jgi:xanthosine utilization system XapX-like protein
MTRTLGIILIVLGLIGVLWGGFSYTTREKVVDLGPIDVTRDKTHSVPLPPIFGAVALIGGIVLLVSGKKGLSSS